MLVIVSDLHLTDGTTGTAVQPGAFHIFAERLQDLAIRASWRSDGEYRPIEQLDVLLLGDIFDLTNSTKWLQAGVRPWHDVHSPAVLDAVSSITDGILAHNREAISVLRSTAAEGAIRIPPASQTGEPAYGVEGCPVAVRTYYMVGNHDWLLHLGGARYDIIRQRVVHQMGLATVHDAPFPHDPYESEQLLATLRRHRVFARHGDVFDPINFTEDRDASSLGDAIVIDLVNRFSMEVRQQMGSDLPDGVNAGLDELVQIRPLLLIPVWLDGLLERCGIRPAYRKHIKHTWDELADEFLQLPMVREQDAWSPFDLIDGLERALKFSKRLSIGWASKIASWLHSLRGTGAESYYQHALAEQDFRNRRARHIIYGHTHVAETVPLDASYADGYVLNQMYFNSGSWRRVYRQTQSSVGEHEFIPTETMTFLTFFHGDERGGRPFETWSGTLAAGGVQVPVHRVDAARTSHAAEQPIPAPRVPVRPPHFQRPSAPTRPSAVRRM